MGRPGREPISRKMIAFSCFYMSKITSRWRVPLGNPPHHHRASRTHRQARTGHGSLIEFHSVVNAVRCAIEV